MKLVLLLVALTAVYTANCRDQDSNIEALLFPDEPANTDITGEEQLFPNEQLDDASIGETQRVLIGQENQNIDEEVQQMKENYEMGSVSDHRSSMTKERKRCIPTISCTSAGGHCVKKSGDCKGTVDRYGCRGNKKCKCCIPDNIICLPVSTTAAPTTTSDPCSSFGGTSIDGQCIIFNEDSKTWAQAVASCEAKGQRLAVIQNLVAVNAYLRCNHADKAIWLGASDIDKEGNWVWIDGVPVPSSLWPSGQPDNVGVGQDCLGWGFNYNYDDSWCTAAYNYLCELV